MENHKINKMENHKISDFDIEIYVREATIQLAIKIIIIASICMVVNGMVLSKLISRQLEIKYLEGDSLLLVKGILLLFIVFEVFVLIGAMMPNTMCTKYRFWSNVREKSTITYLQKKITQLNRQLVYQDKALINSVEYERKSIQSSIDTINDKKSRIEQILQEYKRQIRSKQNDF